MIYQPYSLWKKICFNVNTILSSSTKTALVFIFQSCFIPLNTNDDLFVWKNNALAINSHPFCLFYTDYEFPDIIKGLADFSDGGNGPIIVFARLS